MKPFWVYILRCSDNSYYTGHTDNLDHRIAQHNAGDIAGCYTASRLPVTLAFSQPCATRAEALSAERQIKGWSRAKKRTLIDGTFDLLPELARNHQVEQR